MASHKFQDRHTLLRDLSGSVWWSVVYMVVGLYWGGADGRVVAQACYLCIYYIHISIYIYLYLYVPDEGSLLPKYRDCTTSNYFELYLMCCGVMLQ